MKQVRATLWVSMGEMKGQRSRPCFVDYSVLPIGSGHLYQVHHISDARTEEKYCVDTTISLNSDMDVIIAAADPKQREFSKRELGIDLRNQPKKKPMKKKIVQSTETNDLLDGL